MKLSILLSIITMMTFFGLYTPQQAHNEKISIGVYDPKNEYKNVAKISYESVFFGWDVKSKNYQTVLQNIKEKQRIPLITIEPWQHKNDTQYLANIVKGKYDTEIETICRPLKNVPNGTIVRFAHEMELAGRYPWSKAEPTAYINTYKYFVEKCRNLAGSEIRFMWSPSGEDSLKEYWPGADYVDLIGLSIYMNKEWDKVNIGHQRNFIEILDSKYKRVASFSKPIFIAESAVTNTVNMREEWLTEGFRNLYKYPLIKGYVYFNSKDTVGVWGTDYQTPDWSMSADIFTKAIEKYAL